jgi:hypothetical protein
MIPPKHLEHIPFRGYSLIEVEGSRFYIVSARICERTFYTARQYFKTDAYAKIKEGG